jgi:hypothetical protein
LPLPASPLISTEGSLEECSCFSRLLHGTKNALQIGSNECRK